VTEGELKDWFTGLESFLEDENCPEILQQPSRLFNADEIGIQLEPNPKSVKLLVPKGIDDVFIVKRRNSKRSVTVRYIFDKM
jgi:hypothetical protein